MYPRNKRNRNIRLILSVVLIMGLTLTGHSGISEPAHDYESFGKRDPFVPLIGGASRTSMGGLQGIVSIEDVSFQGIVIGADGQRAAVINDEIFRKGDSVGGVSVEHVGKEEVVIKINEQSYRLHLFE